MEVNPRRGVDMRVRCIAWSAIVAVALTGASPAWPDTPLTAAAVAPSSLAQPASETAPAPPDLRRLGGADRFATALEISRAAFIGGADAVYVATGGNFPDALAAGAPAGLSGAPILTVPSDGLPDAIAVELNRLDPARVFVVGGTTVVSDGVATAISSMTGARVERLAGVDRYETAAAVSATTYPPGLDVVYVATGLDFPDALAGGPLAASRGAPILLVHRDLIPDSTATELERLAPTSIVILGGAAAVSDAVAAQLAGFTSGGVSRLAGSDRFATAVAISQAGYATAGAVYLATGLKFPDALAGAPAAFIEDGPVLLTAPDCVQPTVLDEIERLAPDRVVVLGGTAAVGPDAAALKPCGATGGILPIAVGVDPTLAPRRDSVVGLDPGDAPRPVAALADSNGVQTDFVTGELIVVGQQTVLDEVLARTGGTLVETFGDLDPPVHLVHVATPAASGDLASLLRDIDPRAHGELVASSAEALALLTLVADLVADGYTVSVNPTVTGHDLADGVLAEAPAAVATLTGYTPNPHDWAYLNYDDVPRIGVPEAWQALAWAGRIPADAARIRIGVLDGGFAQDADLPPGTTGVTGQPNAGDCGGNPCPWHGTNVAVTLAGRVNNGWGAAGVAGPVATLSLGGYTGDVGGTIKTIANTLGADILNMSFSFSVGALASVLTLALDPVVWSLSKAGKIFVACAGNDGTNVDATRNFMWWEYEEERFIPCELSSVICVGGLRAGTIERDPGSNWGREDVDIWAPFTVYVGADPANPANEVRTVSGTSFSSPYVAGVLALIKAANPSQGRSTIINRMYDTARYGSGADLTVGSYVVAKDAVESVFGGNSPPSFTVVQPVDGSEYGRGTWLPLIAQVSDPEGLDLRTEWTLDGQPLATSNSTQHWITTALAFGPHTVTATLRDGPYARTLTRRFTVVNTPPYVEMLSPPDPTTACASCNLNLRAADPIDPDEPGGELADSRLEWRVIETQQTVGFGRQLNVTGSAIGPVGSTYRLQLRGTDSAGALRTDGATITVTADPVDIPPAVAIVEPEAGGSGLVTGTDATGAYRLVTLEAVAVDPDGMDVLSYLWTITTRQVSQPAPVFVHSTATDNPAAVKLYNIGPDETVTYKITVTVTEPDGPSSTDAITYSVVAIL
jgi:serine protease